MPFYDNEKTTHREENPQLLTKYPSGSLREQFSICLPLILSSLSSALMVSADRVILAHYNPNAMNAAVMSAVVFYTFAFGAISVAGISEVFVGQHNGAQRYHKIGEPVWQMIWFSVMLFCLFPIIGMIGQSIFIPEEFQHHGAPYFFWLMMFAPLFAMTAALSGFFIGRGQTHVVSVVIILGTVCNILLDLLLIFGVPGVIPSLGTKGAAIATGLAELMMSGVLFSLFIRKDNQRKYATLNHAFNWSVFKSCLNIGLPNAMGHIIAITSWAILMAMLAKVSFTHITVFTIAQSIWILFEFVSEGSLKGICAISANLIGAKAHHKIFKVFLAGVKLQMIYLSIVAIPLIVYPDVLIGLFLPQGVDSVDAIYIHDLVRKGCLWLWIAMVFDAMRWVIFGILTAEGDTRYAMIVNATTGWIFTILPVYLFVLVNGHGPMATMRILAFYTVVNAVCFYLRLHSKKWHQLNDKPLVTKAAS